MVDRWVIMSFLLAYTIIIIIEETLFKTYVCCCRHAYFFAPIFRASTWKNYPSRKQTFSTKIFTLNCFSDRKSFFYAHTNFQFNYFPMKNEYQKSSLWFFFVFKWTVLIGFLLVVESKKMLETNFINKMNVWIIAKFTLCSHFTLLILINSLSPF